MAERHPLVTPTAGTIVKASTNSTKEAKNDAKTADALCAHPMQILQFHRSRQSPWIGQL